MDFLLSGRFIIGLLIGAALYHFWMRRQASKGM
jgi:hypothetical protein